MEELLQLLKDANEGRRMGMSQAAIDAEIARVSNGQFPNHQALSVAVRQQATNPSLVAQRRQAQMAQDLQPDMEASTGPLEVAARGATVGLSPILGGLSSAATNPTNPLAAFTEGREHAKARIDAFKSSHPIEGAIEELGGGVAGIPLTGGPLARLGKPLERLFGVTEAVPGMAPSAWNLARQGAASGIPAGMIYGAADAQSLSDVPASAGTGGVVGGGLGAGLGMAAKVAGPVYEMLLNRGRGFFRPQAEANRQVMQGLGKVMDPNAADALLSEAEHLRPGLARVGDANPIAYGAALRRTPHSQTVADELRVRTAGSGERLAQSAEAAAGFQPGTAPNAILASGAAEDAFNAYSRGVYKPIEEAHAAMDLTAYPKIASLLSDERIAPVVQKVLRGPIVTDPVVNLHGRQMPVSQLPPTVRNALEQAGALPKPTTVPFTALQQVENELRLMAKRLPEGSNFTRPQLQEAARELRGAMRAEIPGLQQADAGWSAALEMYGPRSKAGNTGLLGAFAQGAKARTLPPEQMAQQLSKLGEDAQSAYRMGLLSDIAGDLRGLRAGVNAARIGTTEGNKSLEPHLKEAFGSQQAMNRFLRTAEVEDFFRRSQEGFSGGSQTAQRGDVARQLFPDENHGRGMVRRVLDQFKRDAVTIPPEQLAEGYAGAMNTRGPEMFNVLDRIRQAQAQAADVGPMMQRVARTVAPVGAAGGREATSAAELAALLALIAGGKKVGRLVTGSTNDRGY